MRGRSTTAYVAIGATSVLSCPRSLNVSAPPSTSTRATGATFERWLTDRLLRLRHMPAPRRQIGELFRTRLRIADEAGCSGSRPAAIDSEQFRACPRDLLALVVVG